MMNPKFRIVLAFALALLLFGCNEQNSLNPETTAGEGQSSFAKSVKTPFAAVVNLGAVPIDPGQFTITNGVLHLRGTVFQGPISGDIVGTATVVVNANFVIAQQKGPGWGTATLEVTELYGQPVSGTWEINLSGMFDGPLFVNSVFSGHLQGQGTGGDLEGTKINATFSDAGNPANNVVDFAGTIHDPHGE